MTSLELKVPPPVVAFLVAIAMWLAAIASPSLAFALPGRMTIAAILVVGGVGVALSGTVSFRRARTTVNPFKPDAASSLVTTGIYRHTRNPMYLGMLLVLAGWAAWLSNVPALAGLPLFVLYIGRFQIAPEERVLSAKFGAAFETYRLSTRRWI